MQKSDYRIIEGVIGSDPSWALEYMHPHYGMGALRWSVVEDQHGTQHRFASLASAKEYLDHLVGIVPKRIHQYDNDTKEWTTTEIEKQVHIQTQLEADKCPCIKKTP